MSCWDFSRIGACDVRNDLLPFVDTSYETETAIRATADEAVVFQGVYVRDENVLTYSGTGAVSYRISDGGKVAVGDVIAEIYPDESAIEQKQQIDTLQEKPGHAPAHFPVPAPWNRRSPPTSPDRRHSIIRIL